MCWWDILIILSNMLIALQPLVLAPVLLKNTLLLIRTYQALIIEAPWCADEFEIFGISTPPNQIGVVNAKLRNVPVDIPGAWMYPDPAPTLPWTYFYAE